MNDTSYRGAVEVLTDPFIFRWTVNEAGYEWLEGKDGKPRLFPRHTPGVGIRQYTPDPGLFREFAVLNPTRDAIQNFAGAYGDLFDRWDITHTLVRRGRFVGGTSLDRWKVKIGDMRDLVAIWDQIQGLHLAELSKIIVRMEKEICYVRDGTNVTLARGELSRFDPRDVLLPARCALQWEINRRLADTDTPTLTVPRLSLTPDNHQRIVFQPCNLLAAMWMEFARVTTGESRLQLCAGGCGKYFQVGRGAQRAHTKTCSPRCRQALSRRLQKGAKEEAKSLR
ncbi:MAG: hypothetical protein ABR880_10460 [Candidatus Sulfotelmatobacter sp.]|jgi:hypothetical protein